MRKLLGAVVLALAFALALATSASADWSVWEHYSVSGSGLPGSWSPVAPPDNSAYACEQTLQALMIRRDAISGGERAAANGIRKGNESYFYQCFRGTVDPREFGRK